MPPADAERMPGWIGVDLVALFFHEAGSTLEQASPELDHLIVGSSRILDVKVQVDLLLLCSIGPLGRSVIRSELHANDPRSACVENAVEVLVVADDVAVKHGGPERALGSDIRCVEDDHVTDQLHAKTVAGPVRVGVNCEPRRLPPNGHLRRLVTTDRRTHWR